MTTIPPERVKELRKRASNYGSLPESTVNDILDDYSVLKAEVKRLNTWHSTLSEAWKARAEKAEAENEKLRNEQALSDKAWDIQRDKLEKAEAESDGWTEVLEDAANKHLRNLDKIARLEAELAVILDAHTAMQTELATLRCEAATLRAEREELKMMHRGTEEARYKLEAELALGNKAWDIKQKQLEEARAELAKHAPLMTSKEEQALNQIAEEPHTHPECPTTDEEWEAERNCRHCQAVEALDHAWEEIRNTAHRLDRAALALKMEKK